MLGETFWQERGVLGAAFSGAWESGLRSRGVAEWELTVRVRMLRPYSVGGVAPKETPALGRGSSFWCLLWLLDEGGVCED